MVRGCHWCKSEYDDDVLPLKGLRKTMKSYKKSLGATFLAVIESFLPLEHLEKRLRNSETLCHISNIKGATKNILKNKKDQDDCMKNFKIYLKNQGPGAVAKVPFADTLNLLLLSKIDQKIIVVVEENEEEVEKECSEKNIFCRTIWFVCYLFVVQH